MLSQKLCHKSHTQLKWGQAVGMSDFCDSCNPYFQYLPPSKRWCMVCSKNISGNM